MIDYSPDCVDFGVSLRALMMLFRNGKWTQLNDLGIERNALHTGNLVGDYGVAIPVTDTAEHLFEMAVDSVDSLRTTRGLRQFLQLCPFALAAASEMLRRYLNVTIQSRRSYYFSERISEKRKDESA